MRQRVAIKNLAAVPVLFDGELRSVGAGGPTTEPREDAAHLARLPYRYVGSSPTMTVTKRLAKKKPAYTSAGGY
jgi:hypothetical protein